MFKMTNFGMKNLDIFHEVKQEIDFLKHIFLIFADKEIFFQEYIEMKLKIFFIRFQRFFKCQK